MKRRQLTKVVATVSASLLLSTASVVASPPASAGVVCHTVRKHYGIGSGDVSIRVGYTDLAVEVCTDGRAITYTNAWSDSDTTSPGSAAGFVLHFPAPHRSWLTTGGYSGGSVGYRNDGSLKDCIPHTTLICSTTNNFYELARVYMLSGLYVRATLSNEFVLAGRVFAVYWHHKSTTTYNGVRFY